MEKPSGEALKTDLAHLQQHIGSLPPFAEKEALCNELSGMIRMADSLELSLHLAQQNTSPILYGDHARRGHHAAHQLQTAWKGFYERMEQLITPSNSLLPDGEWREKAAQLDRQIETYVGLCGTQLKSRAVQRSSYTFGR